ncbi:c-type cytochrome [Aliiroseovarius sp. PrR006]|uniref:c-type cytochrome n=1 Tax=Aliiroseovarius sp. PrR006 TaxID=2706883 RepID=UPI0013D47426|nr:c-type cytochrome [Aliiroseovarius sp. PrR006]NDW53839.1 cytochrome C [Aliiroseovarius sp. PrR006]
MHKFIVIFTFSSMATFASAEVSVERGEYLVRGPAGCGNCHTPQTPNGPDMSNELGGFLVEKNPAFEAWAANITPGGRVSDWSDQELARAIREGIRPDGTVIGPPMPIGLYRGVSDDDLYSIVAFLRTVPASDIETPSSTYNIPLPPAYGPPIDSVTAPPQSVSVEYGAYLAGPIAHCIECHTPMGEKGPMLDTHLGSGGFEFHGPWGTSVSANLTTHSDGLAAYSDDEIKQMITEGVRPDGTRMLPPMGYHHYAAMTENDLDAVILYLRQLPPLPDGG